MEQTMCRQVRLLTLLALALVPALFSMGATAFAADEVFKATAAITLPGGQKINSFDIGFVDPVIGLYVLGDRTNQAVDVVDIETNTVLTQLKAGFVGASGNNDTSGPDGVLIVRHREVWVGDAPCTGAGFPTPCAPMGTSSVKVIDLFNQQLTHTIFTGGSARADELCFDPRNNLVLVANNADTPPFASLISTKTYSVVKKIPFDGTNGAPNSNNGAEQCQWNHRTGKFYISIPGIVGQPTGTGGVAVINPVTQKVEQTFIIPLTSCQAPQGMAIGPDHQILLGCNGPGPAGANNPTAIIDERDGHVIKTLKNQSGSDMVWFNPGDNHYFLARSSAVGPNQLLGVVDADGLSQDQSVVTSPTGTPNSHSVAADPIYNQVYVPIGGRASGNTVCSSAGGNDVQGCIAVFTTPNDDPGQRMRDRRDDRDGRR
jgi:hypothetical protein